MKKINKFAATIIIIGIFFTIASFVQYRMLYPDMDKLIAYCGIGICVIAIGILFDCNGKRAQENMELKNKFDYFEEKVQDFVKGG